MGYGYRDEPNSNAELRFAALNQRNGHHSENAEISAEHGSPNNETVFEVGQTGEPCSC